MKSLTIISVSAAVMVAAVALWALGAFSGEAAARGNGLPDGAKRVFGFNLIGTPGDYEGGCGNGARIFVERGDHHAHMDIVDDNDGWHIAQCDATGGDRAELHTDDLGSYDVYVRMLGKPGGTLDVCVDTKLTHDADLDGIHDCLIGSFSLTRDGGQSKFGIQPDALFDASLEDLTWSMDVNDDFRIAQFIVVQTSQ
ncbi:MAG TPA: hypothetical protein VFY90_11510 [Tepidiformaceae bacterium]|nr:hypothetical protein [Tepidiformaceae bacterium]